MEISSSGCCDGPNCPCSSETAESVPPWTVATQLQFLVLRRHQWLVDTRVAGATKLRWSNPARATAASGARSRTATVKSQRVAAAGTPSAPHSEPLAAPAHQG